MGNAQEKPVLEFLQLLDAADFRPHLSRAMELFAEDATYQINVPARPKVVGRDAIVGELERQSGDYTDCLCEIHTVVSDDRYVITERTDHVTMKHDGTRVSNPLLAIFEINDDGLIQNWREYWDALSLSVRMGVDPVRMQELMGISPVIVGSPSVDVADLQRATGWQIKPEGACKGPVCVPLPGDVRTADGRVDLSVLAGRLGMALVAEPSAHVWALGPESAVSGRALTTANAPELELPDLAGRPFRLADLHGQKVVLAAWASWCGCREDLRLWAALREELHEQGLEIVTVAMDTAGAEAARPWIEKAAPRHPALIDSAHMLGARLGVVNVPNALWIDENGRIVRPAEPAWLEDPHASSEVAAQVLEDLPPDHRAVREQIARMNIDHAVYPRMIRDWARHGARSRFVLPEDEVIARSAPRGMDQSRAAAHFELGEHLRRAGARDAAVEHWRAAHRLQPDNWTYKRQAWNLEEPESVRTVARYGSGWLDDVRTLGAENYYPRIAP